MNLFSKTLAAGAAALTLAVAFAPAAEARGRHGHGFHGHHGGHGWHGHRGHHWGWRGRHWGAPVIIGGGYVGGCYIARKRIYDPYLGRVVFVRRTVCG